MISVDAKKKANVGEFKNQGRTWRKTGQPVEVNVYDFASLGVGKAIPYRIYDVNRNEGMVNVSTSYDTSEFAVESIRRWWLMFGKYRYPDADGLLICADGGGSNGIRRGGWKFYLQELSDQIGIPITICHYPPGTSKWNKIEHCMFSFIKLIGNTTTNKGLSVAAHIDEREYEKGIEFSDSDMAQLQLQPHSLHPEWNYSILSRDSGVCVEGVDFDRLFFVRP
ncbi:MAG: hypothetical protein C5S49_00700 [Candidatus Methanogaster sp.]|nr:MAG: hypothetical protein C5S49_00700 [ANME-2 cluster archaeon]